MKKVELNVLRQRVKNNLIRIINSNDTAHYRCHELTRLLREELKNYSNDNLKVMDGFVKYNPKGTALYAANNFDANFFGGYLQALGEEKVGSEVKANPKVIPIELRNMAKSLPEGIDNGYYQGHSWLEGEEIIVDFNPVAHLTKKKGKIPQLLIVEPKDSLENLCSYDRKFKERKLFGHTWLYSFGRPTYLYRLEI